MTAPSISGERAARAAENHFTYDVFVVHADAAADEAFVNGYLLAKLGLEPERVLRLQTLELGQFIIKELERGVRSSWVTIVVLSTAYMDDQWAAFGEQLAACASVAKGARGVLLPLLLEDCELGIHVQSLVKLDFRDRSRAEWEAEIDRLRRYLARPAILEPELPCPYPGMRPFTENDAGRFFGRESELEHIVRQLRCGKREIYVIGASGSGKSSLVSAGLVPLLARGVDGLPHLHVRSFRPGDRPVERLARALEGDRTASAASIGRLLVRHPPATSLLLVVDQLEELFTITTEDQRRDFLASVRALRTDPRCALLFTLRADFCGALRTSSLWTDNGGRISRIDLGPLGSDGLRKVIECPARNVGVYLEPLLTSRLLDDAAREPGVLPLLQETLCQLWGKRRQQLLALAEYNALSTGAQTGLAAAVEKHADLVLDELSPAETTIAFRILLRLVAFGQSRADTRRQQPRDALRSEGEAMATFDAVLQHLVDHRLVTVTGDDRSGDVRADLAHEILIQAWSKFTERIQTYRAAEQRRRELEAAAADWRASGGGSDGLLGPDRLAAAVTWRQQAARELGHTADLGAFMVASEAAQRQAMRRRRQASWLLAVAPVIAAMSMLALAAHCNASQSGPQDGDPEAPRHEAAPPDRPADAAVEPAPVDTGTSTIGHAPAPPPSPPPIAQPPVGPPTPAQPRRSAGSRPLDAGSDAAAAEPVDVGQPDVEGSSVDAGAPAPPGSPEAPRGVGHPPDYGANHDLE